MESPEEGPRPFAHVSAGSGEPEDAAMAALAALAEAPAPGPASPGAPPRSPAWRLPLPAASREGPIDVEPPAPWRSPARLALPAARDGGGSSSPRRGSSAGDRAP